MTADTEAINEEMEKFKETESMARGEIPMKNEKKVQDEEKKVSEKHVSITLQVKWEKRTTRTSSRVHKKPNCLGNNVIVK